MAVSIDLASQTTHSTGFPLNASEWNSRITEFNVSAQNGTKDSFPRSLVRSLNAGENLTAGDFVRVSGSTVLKADNTTAAGVTNFLGCATETVTSGNPVKVAYNFVEGLTGLTAGATYYIGTSGAITSTKPTTFAKSIGYAMSTTSIVLENFSEENQTFSNANIVNDFTVGKDFAVNTSQFFVNEATGNIGFGTATPNRFVTYKGGSSNFPINSFEVGNLSFDSNQQTAFSANENEYARFTGNSSSNGGKIYKAFNKSASSDALAHRFQGYVENNTTTKSVFHYEAFKHDGAGGLTAVSDASSLMCILNNGTAKFNVLGDGAVISKAYLGIEDGVTAPATVSGRTFLYVDSSDGDLKVKFGDGTVKTIATDT